MKKLTEDNYYSKEANKEYCSASQLKEFLDCKGRFACEAKAIAIINGEYEEEIEPPTEKAFLIGSYVDCALLTPDELPKFIENHPELFSSRGATKGQLKAEFQIANKMIERAKQDKFFMRTLEGDHQSILTGKIEGLKFKAKLDVLNPKWIVDLKTTKSITQTYLNPLTKQRETFIEFFDYITQAAIYRELVKQNYGYGNIPFYISAISKEKEPDIAVIQIPNEMIDERLEFLKPYIENVKLLKEGKATPCKCGNCDYCRKTKVLTKPILLQDLYGETEIEGNEQI